MAPGKCQEKRKLAFICLTVCKWNLVWVRSNWAVERMNWAVVVRVKRRGELITNRQLHKRKVNNASKWNDYQRRNRRETFSEGSELTLNSKWTALFSVFSFKAACQCLSVKLSGSDSIQAPSFHRFLLFWGHLKLEELLLILLQPPRWRRLLHCECNVTFMIMLLADCDGGGCQGQEMEGAYCGYIELAFLSRVAERYRAKL